MKISANLWTLGLKGAILTGTLLSGVMHAAPGGPPSSTINSSSSRSGGKGYRTFILTPLSAGMGESSFKGEYNLGGAGGLTLELTGIGKRDIYSDKEIEDHNGDTFVLEKGSEIGLHYAYYANGTAMSGGYWSVGAGLRTMETRWNRTPTGELALNADAVRDADGRIRHNVIGKGAAGHARAGYRYVAANWPFAAGAFAGLRHFDGQFEDDNKELTDGSAATPEVDREAMRRRFMSGLELGLELGFAF